MNCFGCIYEGKIGDKEVHEKCFSCVRALLIRGEVVDNYTPQQSNTADGKKALPKGKRQRFSSMPSNS